MLSYLFLDLNLDLRQSTWVRAMCIHPEDVFDTGNADRSLAWWRSNPGNRAPQSRVLTIGTPTWPLLNTNIIWRLYRHLQYLYRI